MLWALQTQPPSYLRILPSKLGWPLSHSASPLASLPLPTRGTHASGTKDISVCKVLRCEVSNSQAAEDNLGATLHALRQLVINDVPLCIHDGLVLCRVIQADLQRTIFRPPPMCPQAGRGDKRGSGEKCSVESRLRKGKSTANRLRRSPEGSCTSSS